MSKEEKSNQYDAMEDIKASARPKKSASQTVTIRVPIWLKAEILNRADQAGTSPNEWLGTFLYKCMYQAPSEQEVKELKESNQNHKDALQKAQKELKELRKERDDLKKRPTAKQLEEAKAYKERPTQNQLDKLKKEKEGLGKRPTEKQLKDVEKQLALKEKEVESLKQRPTEKEKEEALQALQSKANGLIKKAYHTTDFINRENQYLINDH